MVALVEQQPPTAPHHLQLRKLELRPRALPLNCRGTKHCWLQHEAAWLTGSGRCKTSAELATKLVTRKFQKNNKFSLKQGELVEMGGGFLLERSQGRRLIFFILPQQGLVLAAGRLGVGGQEPPHLRHLSVSVQLSVAWAGRGGNLGKLHHAASHHAII